MDRLIDILEPLGSKICECDRELAGNIIPDRG